MQQNQAAAGAQSELNRLKEQEAALKKDVRDMTDMIDGLTRKLEQQGRLKPSAEQTPASKAPPAPKK